MNIRHYLWKYDKARRARLRSGKKLTKPMRELRYGRDKLALEIRETWREPGQQRKRLRKDYLNAEAVKVIRFTARRGFGYKRLLARLYNVSDTAIGYIVSGRNWKGVAHA